MRRAEDGDTLVPGIASVLRSRIWQGKLRPGDHLNQQILAGSLGASPIPVREALRILEGEGLVTFLPHRGVIVALVTPAEVEEWYLEVKGLVHVLFPLAAERLAPEAFPKLRALEKEMDFSSDAMEAHLAYWRILMGAGGVPRLENLLLQTVWRYGRFMTLGGKAVMEGLKDTSPRRTEVLDALEARDGVAAETVFLEWLRVRKDAYLDLLRS